MNLPHSILKSGEKKLVHLVHYAKFLLFAKQLLPCCPNLLWSNMLWQIPYNFIRTQIIVIMKQIHPIWFILFIKPLLSRSTNYQFFIYVVDKSCHTFNCVFSTLNLKNCIWWYIRANQSTSLDLYSIYFCAYQKYAWFM